MLSLRRYLFGRNLNYIVFNKKLSHYSAEKCYDVIVIGGGHAGTEASSASARIGAQTLLVTHKIETIGEMSCNPSFGGIGKGHLMREIDALGGVCARICDQSGIHYKVLNRRKGPAVWGYRAQIDRKLYKQNVQNDLLDNTPNLDVLVGSVENLLVEESGIGEKMKCCGIILANGTKIRSSAVVITTGTFLNGRINTGPNVYPAGRIGDPPSIGLANTLAAHKLRMGRLKTGTPPRLRANTINYAQCTVNHADNPPLPFSFLNERVWLEPSKQLPCYLTQTPLSIESIVRDNLHLNRHVTEEVNGPRYCPSIESKVLKFGGRHHQIWLEPEGFDSDLVYPNGMSCTLPENLQVDLVHCIPGLEKAEVVRAGYGVEYDFVDPRELETSLQVRKIPGLFLAGQINGTTGYEEAAAQGIIAGINAALSSSKKEPFVLSRTDSYIGVLIDDLTTLGTNEPYRMFTSRAEFRLSLRPDNADLRLTAKAYKVGAASERRHQNTEKIRTQMSDTIELLKSIVKPCSMWRKLLRMPSSKSEHPRTAFSMLGTNEGVTMSMLGLILSELSTDIALNSNLCNRIEIEAHYNLFIAEQAVEVEEIRNNESLIIPENVDYTLDSFSFSMEEKEKLLISQPQTIAAASRIPGITPSTLLRLLRFVKKGTQPNYA